MDHCQRTLHHALTAVTRPLDFWSDILRVYRVAHHFSQDTCIYTLYVRFTRTDDHVKQRISGYGRLKSVGTRKPIRGRPENKYDRRIKK